MDLVLVLVLAVGVPVALVFGIGPFFFNNRKW